MWASTIREAHRSLVRGDISVTKLCNEALNRAREVQNLNAFITICQKESLTRAAQLDSGQPPTENGNPLFGIPITIKDNFCTNQILTSCGSKMLHNFIPPYTATVVEKLLNSNCVMIGKTNMDEFAMGSSSTTSYYGPAANIWKQELLAGREPGDCDANNWYMAGGSSTGSAIAVASGSCFASIGTDTGGSTRQPASLTGTVGFKPTYGLISRFGLIPLAHCLDVVSLLARNVEDIGVIFNQVIGIDVNDLTSVDHKKVLQPATLHHQRQTIRVGIPEEFVRNGELDEDISEHFGDMIDLIAAGAYKSSNADSNIRLEVVKISLPHAYLATECYTVISSAEIASNMSCYDGVKYGYSTEVEQTGKSFNRDEFFKANRDTGFGPEVKKRILLGNYFLLSENRERYLVQAWKLRRLISEDFSRVFNDSRVDVILMPSTPTTSISYAQWLQKQDCNKLFREDYFLIPANLANVPAISLPSGTSRKTGLPIGLQLIANRFHDLDLLSISQYFEQQVFTSTQEAP